MFLVSDLIEKKNNAQKIYMERKEANFKQKYDKRIY